MDAPSFTMELGDVVQLNPETVKNKAFAGCFLQVSEQRAWGVIGFVQALGETREAPGGRAYYRANWEEIEPVGKAVWILAGGDMMGERVGRMVSIPVAELQFDGRTIWVHSPLGATVLRIAVRGGITTSKCGDNVVSHLDLIVKEPAEFCLAADAEEDSP